MCLGRCCGEELSCRAELCTDVDRIQQLCSDYCDTYLTRCTSDTIDVLNAFENKRECMEVCRTYPTNAEDGATTGDTLECRLNHLAKAIEGQNVAVSCENAGADSPDCSRS